MRYSLAFVLPALALASPMVEKRADLSSALLNDLANIVTQIGVVNASVSSLQPNQKITIVQGLKIDSQTNQLGLALKQTLADAQATDPLNSDESTALANAVIKLIGPVKGVVGNLIAHKSELQNNFVLGDLSKTIETVLKNEQNITQTLGNILGPKLAAPYNTAAPTVVAQLVAIFQPGLDAFAKCGGKGICLPPIIIGKGNQP